MSPQSSERLSEIFFGGQMCFRRTVFFGEYAFFSKTENFGGQKSIFGGHLMNLRRTKLGYLKVIIL